MTDDLADRLDDLICTFDNVATSDYGTLLLLLVAWMIVGLSLAFLNNFIHSQTSKPVQKYDPSQSQTILLSSTSFSSSSSSSLGDGDITSACSTKGLKKNKNRPGIGQNMTLESLANEEHESEAVTAKNAAIVESAPSYPMADTNPCNLSRIVDLPDKSAEKRLDEPKHDLLYDIPIHPPKLVLPEICVSTESLPSISGITIPKSLGSDDEASKWVNQCFENVLKNSSVREAILRQWQDALVDYIRQANDGEGFDLDVIEINQIDCPLLSNVMTKSHPHDNMTVTADLVAAFSLHMRIQIPSSEVGKREKNTPTEQWDWLLLVQELRGRISLAILSRERLIIAKLDGWPEVTSRMAVPNSKLDLTRTEHDEFGQRLHDMMMMAIRSSQITIDMEEFGHHVFPVYKKVPKRLKSVLKSSGDHKNRFQEARSRSASLGARLKQIKVHISKARDLGNSCRNPYVVIEMDEPNQIYTSCNGIVIDQGNDVSFEYDCSFNLNARSTEMLFEVWESDSGGNGEKQFLGLGIVSLEELLIVSKQTQVIPLQGGPFEDFKEPVNGLLTVEFNVLGSEGCEMNNRGFREIERDEELKSPGVWKHEETPPLESCGAPALEQHPLAKIPGDSATSHFNGDQNYLVTMPEKTLSSPATRLRKDVMASPHVNPSDSTALLSLELSPVLDRGRRKGKKSLMKSLRHRLSTTARSLSLEQHLHQERQTQSGSLGNGSSGVKRKGQPRSISSDHRGRSLTELRQGALDTHPSRCPRRHYRRKRKDDVHRGVTSNLSSSASSSSSSSSSLSSSSSSSSSSSWSLSSSISDSMSECSLTLGSWKGALSGSWQSASILNVPSLGDDGSSQSDLSGISNVSNRTYLNEESSLILEATDNGMKRAYLVPYEVAKQGKLRRKGVKLHVYMDHIFVAKHVKGGTMCEVCQSSIPIRLGKQGYVCRDCGLVCHKACHVRVENHCTETSLPAMEIECYNDSAVMKAKPKDDLDPRQKPTELK
ncbi:uncharacterized protein LOC131883608 isoform X2 [Tigriopus californicus]|uniref:uncharacterized protein LOC131883608 isoform X2 n=1 Tax=Tigriopus californicus TaxID=6832 RepID=UPI0027DA11A7|nr:uncharacterized protein LOC131883608 isoform X2 [Tigriopus californicus]